VVRRQVGIEWADADPPPGVGAGAGAGAEDATGVYLWGSAVLLARWLVQKRALLRGKVVLELGAGCGLPSLAAWLHTEASLVPTHPALPSCAAPCLPIRAGGARPGSDPVAAPPEARWRGSERGGAP